MSLFDIFVIVFPALTVHNHNKCGTPKCTIISASKCTFFKIIWLYQLS